MNKRWLQQPQPQAFSRRLRRPGPLDPPEPRMRSAPTRTPPDDQPHRHLTGLTGFTPNTTHVMHIKRSCAAMVMGTMPMKTSMGKSSPAWHPQSRRKSREPRSPSSHIHFGPYMMGRASPRNPSGRAPSPAPTSPEPLTHDTIVALAVLGVVGQVIAVGYVLVVALAGLGVASRSSSCGCALGIRALGGLPRLGDRDRRQPVLLRDRRLRPLRALLVPADLHVSALDHHPARGARAATIGSRATCSRCRSSAPASRSTTCWSRTASSVRATPASSPRRAAARRNGSTSSAT